MPHHRPGGPGFHTRVSMYAIVSPKRRCLSTTLDIAQILAVILVSASREGLNQLIGRVTYFHDHWHLPDRMG